MGSRIVPAELRDNMTEHVGALEMKSPTYKFKKNMPSIGGKKGKNKVTVIAAPVSFTDAELEQYEYWLALQSCIRWLYEKPKDKYSKDLLMDFMALYAKIKMAMQAVVPGKVNVIVGKGRTDGQDIVLTGGWYDTAQGEADFAVSFFTSYISSVCGSNALNTLADRMEKQIKIYNGRIRKLEEDVERRDMRIADLENAVKKMEASDRASRNPLARSQGRLPGKRPSRVKAKPVRMKGKRRG